MTKNAIMKQIVKEIKMNKYIKAIILSALLCFSSVSAVKQVPFFDVKQSDELYWDLSLLYNNNVIKDTDDNLFKPDSLIPRDEFIWIVVWVWCKDCLNPTMEDYIKYSSKPFVDVEKDNSYFYCISHGKATWITQWYDITKTWKHTCQNDKTYTETPFCPTNAISRIEAVAILLRTSKMWDDVLNAKPEKTMNIADVNDDWYWFAKKWIEVWILKKDKDNKVFPNEYINRREFVHMAAKIFWLNFCALEKKAPANEINWMSSKIKIYDETNKDSCSWVWTETKFPDYTKTTYDFYWYTETKWNLTYEWEFINTTTWESKKATWQCLNNYDLWSSGKWIAKLKITNTDTKSETVSYSQVIVNKQWDTSKTTMSLNIDWNPLSWEKTLKVDFKSILTGWEWKKTYSWDFWDGNKSTEQNPTNFYTKEWTYTVTLKVTDEKWNEAISQVVIKVTWNSDKDWDWFIDSVDKCPEVYSLVNSWCPFVDEFKKNNDTKTTNYTNKITWDLKVYDKNNTKSCNWEWSETVFPNNTETVYDFYAYTENPWNFEYTWTFINQKTWEKITATWKCLNNFDLKSDWKWDVSVVIKNPADWQTTTSSTEITVTKSQKDNFLSVNIQWDPLTWEAPLPVEFKSIVWWWSWTLWYSWDFGDWKTSTSQNPTHTFDKPWVYEVTLLVTDSAWLSAKSTLTVVVKAATWIVNKISWDLKIFDNNNVKSCVWTWPETVFPNKLETVYDFFAYTENTWNYEYTWTFINKDTWEKITATWKCLNNFDLKSDWKWEVNLVIKDPATWETTTSFSEVLVAKTANQPTLSLNIKWDPLTWEAPLPVNFEALVWWWTWDIKYSWDFWDWKTSQTKNPSHTFEKAWVFTVTLLITDSNWLTAKSSLTIVVKSIAWIWPTFKKKDEDIWNKCIQDKAKWKWLVEWMVICQSCPCTYNIDFIASMRACDILFPSITSPDKKKIYSRWKIYQIP